tara:strand:- start:479 stop:1057 length:579 start_codon:yes stop_codon:yes gene_type:complete
LWTKTYGGELEDIATGLWPTNDGGCIVVGKSNSFTSGDFNGYMVKIDSNGDSLWTRNYGDTGDEGLNSVQQTPDNGYVMAGFTNSIGAGDFDMLLLKTDSLGSIDYNTSVDETHISKLNFTVYPNPVTELLEVKSNEEISTPFIVKNIYGKMVAKYPKGLKTLDVSGLTNGVYFLNLIINKTPVMKRFVVVN